MTFHAFKSPLIALAAMAASGSCLSQTSDQTAGLTVFGAQRFWFATQHVKLVDAAIELPGATGSPVISTRETWPP